MATPDQTQASGADSCPSCGAAMAPDQRYCLTCGARRGAPRVDAAPEAVVAAAPEPSSQRPGDVSPLAAVLGIALLGGMLLIGVLIGRSGSDDSPPPAPIVQVDPSQTTPAPTTTPTDPGTTPPAGGVTSDWPPDQQAFTVQLSLVPKDGATQDTVDAAKESATSSGATDVGALDSDLYPSLEPGNYIIYSGIFEKRQDAVNALGGLGEGFPDATVIEVAPTGTAPPPPEGEAGSGSGGNQGGASAGASD